MTYDNNTLYVDIDKLQHKLTLHNNHSPRIKLYLGSIGDTEFEQQVETIKDLPDEIQNKVRGYIRSIFDYNI